ncbi:thioredoxin domain-containing protein [Halobacteriales archaeon QH_8_67_36]|nr:MAG: thioredoxin domain-containing protein [Halobacteriales archaeon QH_8_67_36]
MDEFAAETKVEWREWGPEAFERAAGSGKPLLLSLTVPWSPECRAMDRGVFGEPRIAANINDGFVPVRVDADRNPLVRERYTMGGFPSTVFLTPAGEVISGATLLGSDGFRSILDSVRESWDAKGTAAGSVPRQLQDEAPPAGALTPRIEEHMVEQLLESFDEEFGGWGSDVKFPLARTVEFALVRARDQATRTLEAIRTHLLDTYDGGFYRYATGRDWSNPRREKLLDENAALVRAFARGYRYTGSEAYRDTAMRTVEYLTTELWTGDAFASSQAGDDDYYQASPTDREDADPPHVDGTVFADRNGLAVDGLLWTHAYTDDERAGRYAKRARDYVTKELVDGHGAVIHGDAVDSYRGLLIDQAGLLQGLTTSWQVLGEGGPAEAVADWTIDNRRQDTGAFRDGPDDGAGLCGRSLHPLDSTVELADALVDLAALTGDDTYREVARQAVESFAGAAERMGVEVAGYAGVAARLRDPQRLVVGTAAGTDLHRAALRLADHETTVVPDPDGDGVARRYEGETVTAEGETPADLEAALMDGTR